MPLGRVRTRTTVAKADSSVVGVLKVEDGIVRNMRIGGREEPVDDLSGVLKKEVTNPRKDTPFVVLISLLATLALARAYVLLTGAAETTTETSTYIGRNLIIGGYHIHHFFYGFASSAPRRGSRSNTPPATCRPSPLSCSAEDSVFAWTKWGTFSAGR